MRLYKIIVEHSSPKDSQYGTICMKVFNTTDELYDYFKNPYTKETYINTEEYPSLYMDFFDNEDTKKEEADYKEQWLANEGDIDAEYVEYQDLYYGLSVYGFTDMGEITQEEFDVLNKLKLIQL